VRITASGAERWVRGFLGEWRTALRITAVNFRARTQYRGDFVTALAMGLARKFSTIDFSSNKVTGGRKRSGRV
jgi:hypothetical protein